MAAAALIVRVLLAVTRCSSPAVHRLAWCLVLLQGWLFVRLPVIISYSGPPPPQPVAAGGRAHGVDNEALHSRPFGVKSPATPLLAGPAPSTEVTTLSWRWPVAVAGVWLSGMGVLVVCSLVSYLRFARRLPPGQPAEEDWVRQWDNLLAGRGIRRAIPLRVTFRTGPLLCRLPSGYQLLVPARLWQSLAPAERLSMLRHELAHYERGDHWKSLGTHLLALPHWFNPLAWWAVRNFDECAEWACDWQATAGNPAETSSYARALLQLGKATSHPFCHSPAAQGHGLSVRLRRLLAPRLLEDPVMKKVIVISVAAVLAVFGLVRVDLVAKHAPPDDLATAAPAEQKQAGEPPAKSDLPQQEAVLALERLGARLWKNERGEVVRLYWSSATDDGLALLEKLPTLEDVNLETSENITEAGLAHLKGPAKLQRLSLCSTQTNDASLAQLAGLTELEELLLSSNRITDAGLVHLNAMTKLRKLNLMHASAVASGVWITDAGIAQLAGLKELRILEIDDIKVTERGLKQLSGLTKLEILGLRSGTVDDRALGQVTAFRNLTNLGLHDTAVTDAGLNQLASLSQLQSLGLSSDVITDDGLANLKPLTRLSYLELRGRRFTDAALARVAELPSLRELHLSLPLDERNARFTAAGLEHLKTASKLETLWLFEVRVARPEADQLAQLGQLKLLMLDLAQISGADVQYLRRALPNVQIHVGTGAGIKAYGPPSLLVVVRADDPIKQRVEETLQAMSQRGLPYRIGIVKGSLSPGIPYCVVEVTRAASGEYRLVVIDPTKGQKDDAVTEAFQALLPRLRGQ